MRPDLEAPCTAFLGSKLVARGQIREVALKVKRKLEKLRGENVLIFDDRTSAQIEIDFRGTPETVLKRIEAFAREVEAEQKVAGPGRPRLGVVSREIGLLPRHWEWLALQPGGASGTLRRLVDEARTKYQDRDRIRLQQDAAYKFMTAMAGDSPQYEEALRAFYSKKRDLFLSLIEAWPKDVRGHAIELAAPVFESGT